MNRSYGGISIEHPCHVSDHDSGKIYEMLLLLTNPDKAIMDATEGDSFYALDLTNVMSFEYVNEINCLCLTGSLVYTDINGEISKFFNHLYNHIVFSYQEVERVQDGENTTYEPVKRADGSGVFTHVFIVQNTEIIERDHQAITYKLSLVSSYWYKLCSQIVYSNHGFGKISEIKGNNGTTMKISKNPYEMLKIFLTNDGLPVDAESFDRAARQTAISIPFITNGNDTMFTVLPYMLNMLYYKKDQFENSLKFIVYSPWQNEGEGIYRCIDYEDTANWTPVAKTQIILSLFETTMEQSLFSEEKKLGSVVGKPMTSLYRDQFDHTLWSYDRNYNKFNSKYTTMDTSKIVSLENNKPLDMKEMFNSKVLDKYPVELNPSAFSNNGTYFHQSSLWNNDYNFYNKIIDNLLRRDALIVYMTGDVTHQPGTALFIDLDRTIEKVPEITKEQKEELYKKHREIDGIHAVLKVRHMFGQFSADEKEAYLYNFSYKENVVLGRNFNAPNKKKQGAISALASTARDLANKAQYQITITKREIGSQLAAALANYDKKIYQLK